MIEMMWIGCKDDFAKDLNILFAGWLLSHNIKFVLLTSIFSNLNFELFTMDMTIWLLVLAFIWSFASLISSFSDIISLFWAFLYSHVLDESINTYLFYRVWSQVHLKKSVKTPCETLRIHWPEKSVMQNLDLRSTKRIL